MIQETVPVVIHHSTASALQKPVQQRRWYAQMDGLRCVAVSAVLVEHFAYFLGHRFHLGFFGVDLFFVISGFLITEGLLIEKDKYTPSKVIKRFYTKRFLRIFPIYYLLAFIALFTFHPFKEIASWAFTYTINYYPAITGKEIIDPFGHLWSLSVEEQFYLFWPCVLLITPRKYFLTVLGLIFLSSIIYFAVKHDYYGLPGRMYSLCMGALLAFTKYKMPEQYSNSILKRFSWLLVLAMVLYFFDPSIALSTLSLGLVYIGSNNGFNSIFKRFLENKKVIYIGKISYGVYLYHLPVAYLFTIYVFDPVWNSISFGSLSVLKFNSWVIKLPLYALLTFLIAHISYSLIEKPILKYKERLK